MGNPDSFVSRWWVSPGLLWFGYVDNNDLLSGPKGNWQDCFQAQFQACSVENFFNTKCLDKGIWCFTQACVDQEVLLKAFIIFYLIWATPRFLLPNPFLNVDIPPTSKRLNPPLRPFLLTYISFEFWPWVTSNIFMIIIPQRFNQCHRIPQKHEM